MSDLEAPHSALQPGDLLAYLEGVATPSVAEHIADCPICRAELSGIRAADALLGATLWRSDCPTPDQLLAYQVGFLPDDQVVRVQSHLTTCALCREELALIANPPQPRLLDQLARTGRRLIQAALQPAPAAAALRGSEARRITYDAGGYQVILAVEPIGTSGGGAQLEGQLIGADDVLESGNAFVRLLLHEQEQAQEPIDDLGFFRFDAVPPGIYTLVLSLDAAFVLIDEVSVA